MFVWYEIPRFGRAIVQVIDAVEIHVLCVPGERGSPHAEVEIGRVDSRNGKLQLGQNRVESAHIPRVHVCVEESARKIGAVHGRIEHETFPVAPIDFIEIINVYRWFESGGRETRTRVK